MEDKQKESTVFKDQINQALKDIRSNFHNNFHSSTVTGTTQVEETGKHVTEICSVYGKTKRYLFLSPLLQLPLYS